VVGDFSEDPFEVSYTDVPMNALCRTIDIDVIQMLDGEDVLEPEKALYDTALVSGPVLETDDADCSSCRRQSTE